MYTSENFPPPPMPGILVSIDGVADTYLGYDRDNGDYVALLLEKASATVLRISTANGRTPTIALARLDTTTDIKLCTTDFSGLGYFKARDQHTNKEMVFTLDWRWQAFSVRYTDRDEPSFIAVYRADDPYNPHIFRE